MELTFIATLLVLVLSTAVDTSARGLPNPFRGEFIDSYPATITAWALMIYS